MNLLTKLGLFLADANVGIDEDGSFLNTIYELAFTGTVRILVITGAALFAVIKGVMIGIGIVKAADDSQERKTKIDSLKYLLIGVALVLVLYLGAGALIDLIIGLGE